MPKMAPMAITPGNAQHRQASEHFVMPQIKPDFVPNNAHHAHPCSQSN
jgi:hypothetical protein